MITILFSTCYCSNMSRSCLPASTAFLANSTFEITSILIWRYNFFLHLVQIENQDAPGLSFRTHPNIDKQLFNGQKIVGARDPTRPFPSGQNETPLVKWRIEGLNESSLPLTGILQLFAFSSLLVCTCVTCFCQFQWFVLA